MAEAIDIDLYADDLEQDFNQDGEFNHDQNVDLYDDVITAPSGDGHSGDEYGLGHDDSPPNSSSSVLGNNVAHGASKRVCIYVGNLTWWTTDQDVTDAITSLGVTDVVDIKFYENRANGQSKGFCVVTLGSETSFRSVMEKLPRKELHGQNPVVTSCSRQNLNHFEMQSNKRNAAAGMGRPPGQYGPPGPGGVGPPPGPPGPGNPGPPRMGHPPMIGRGRGQFPPPRPPMGPPPPNHHGHPPGYNQGYYRPPPAPMHHHHHPHHHGPPGPGGPPGMPPRPPPPGMQGGPPPRGPPGPPPMRLVNESRYKLGPPPPRGPPPPMGARGPPPDPRGGPPDWDRPPVNHPPGPPGPPIQGGMPRPPHSGPPQGPHPPAPHVNPAFFPPHQGPPPGPPQSSQSGDPYGRPPPGQYPEYRGPPPERSVRGPPSDRHESNPPISEAEFEEIMGRNRTVSSSAISRAVADASAGDYAASIETLVTAISLIKQSKVVNDERCKILISSLQDTLHGIESKSYGSRSKDRARSRERERSRERSSRREKSSRRDRSRSRERDYRDRSRERDRYHEERYREKDRDRDREREHRSSRH